MANLVESTQNVLATWLAPFVFCAGQSDGDAEWIYGSFSCVTERIRLSPTKNEFAKTTKTQAQPDAPFFDLFEHSVKNQLRFICSDMCQAYLIVIARLG
jgi:hypothetical protein